MRLGLGGEYGRYTDGLQPGSGPHSKFGYGMVKFPRQGLETRRIECDGVQLFNVVERKICDVLWIFYTSETDGDLCKIGGVEKGDMFEMLSVFQFKVRILGKRM